MLVFFVALMYEKTKNGTEKKNLLILLIVNKI